MRIEIEGSRMKREIEMIRAAQNRGADWDYAVIQSQLDAEFASWQHKLQEEQARLTDALNRNSRRLSAEEALALQKLDRELVKRLHPDLNPSIHPERMPLWHRLQDAYGRADLEELRMVELLLGNAPGEETSSSNSEVLKEELERLRKKMAALIEQFESQRKIYPFILKEVLDDPKRMDSLRADLDEKIRIMTQRRDSLAAHLQALLDNPDTPGTA